MQRWLYFVRKDEVFDWTVCRPAGIESQSLWDGMYHSPGAAAGARDEQADVIRFALFARPTAAELEDWCRSVHAMRSVSRRVLGYRPSRRLARNRPTDISPREADAVAARYIGMLRPCLPLFGQRPLRTLDRLCLVPTLPEEVTCFTDGAAVLWQLIFGSMLPGFGVPVCVDCGLPLPESKNGRRSKAERCAKCRQAKWWSNVPPEERRRREREKKRRQRAGG